jgi:hypothetical protein
MIGFETQMLIRLDCVSSSVLKLISEKLIHQPDTAAFLKLVNQNS